MPPFTSPSIYRDANRDSFTNLPTNECDTVAALIVATTITTIGGFMPRDRVSHSRMCSEWLHDYLFSTSLRFDEPIWHQLLLYVMSLYLSLIHI